MKAIDFAIARRRMVEEQLVGGGISDARVLEVMGRVPRHLFVDPALASQAYEDRPLSIGFGQTISQPFIVAAMTAALGLRGHERVLEIGTGCGYQCAVLAELAKKVFSMERLKALSRQARKRLDSLGIFNVTLRVGDGTHGWSEEAPYDAILVTAAAPRIPEPLIVQLSEGGRIVAPVGGEDVQDLIVATKEKGSLKERVLAGCRFVKLVGNHGWQGTRAP